MVPSIVDLLPAGEMAAIIADPVTRTRHVEAIRRFAADGDYDGIDIDYEQFAFADGRDTWAATRPNWVAFIEELGAALRADGRTLVVSIPPVYDDGQTSASGFWVYDYGAIIDHVDRIRIMTYDFSVAEPGPDRSARVGRDGDHGGDRSDRFAGQARARAACLRPELGGLDRRCLPGRCARSDLGDSSVGR